MRNPCIFKDQILKSPLAGCKMCFFCRPSRLFRPNTVLYFHDDLPYLSHLAAQPAGTHGQNEVPTSYVSCLVISGVPNRPIWIPGLHRNDRCFFVLTQHARCFSAKYVFGTSVFGVLPKQPEEVLRIGSNQTAPCSQLQMPTISSFVVPYH